MGELSIRYFNKFKDLIYQNYGIHFSDAKEGLLHSKIKKLMTRNDIENIKDYLSIISDPINHQMITEFINEITVHKTDFFREKMHFDFLLHNFNLILKKNPRIIQNKEVRIWCSACSTGQEAYTIAMVFKELIKTLPYMLELKILATDIATNVLEVAQRGEYPSSIEFEVEPQYLLKYFKKENSNYIVLKEIKNNITFRKFNITEDFPFSNKFDIVFCRNLMIYFDIPTQEVLLSKIHRVMSDGGLLFIGLSESLINKKNEFSYLQPSVYLK